MGVIKQSFTSLCLLVSSVVIGATPEQAGQKLDEFLTKFPDLGPGYGVVVVTPEKVILKHLMGTRHVNQKTPLTADTPIYIASQTKAYMGLLAAKLDAKGILLLKSKISDHWPNVKFPDGVNASDWTMADLLNHKVPIEVDFITFVEAYVTELDAKRYPELIAEFAQKRESGFEYDNLGYNIYGAILYSVTGTKWQDWLQKEIFNPLELTKTSARTSDFKLDELSWNHIWLGKAKGWHIVRPKTDEIMQSAGGMVTSVNDMGSWLQLQLRQSASKQSGVSTSMIKTAQTVGVETDPKRRNAYELPCHGYALGWNVCNFEGNRLYIHGGGYTGARTMMAFSPDLNVGIGVFANSDNMTGWLTSRTIVQYLQYLTEHKDAEKWAEIRPRVYPERIVKLLNHRQQSVAKARQASQWKGWKWQPNSQTLQEYIGTYTYNSIEARILKHKDGLKIQAHSYHADLDPATKDLFGATSVPLEQPDAVQFKRNKQGKVISLKWNDTVFLRR